MADKDSVRLPENEKSKSILGSVILIATGLVLFGLQGDMMSHNHIDIGMNFSSLTLLLTGGMVGIGVRKLMP